MVLAKGTSAPPNRNRPWPGSYTAEDLCHKIQSFMQKLQHRPSLVSSFFLQPTISYLYMQKQYFLAI